MKNFKKVFFSFVVVFGCILGNLDAKSMPFTDPKDSKEVVNVLKSEVVVGCWVYPVTCSCWTGQFQWCDNGFHHPLGPVHRALEICCSKCGDGCPEEEPEA